MLCLWVVYFAGCDLYHTVAFLTRGSLVLFRPATETLQADSRTVLYFPEDGKLTFEGWVVVIKKSDSPRQSPNTNGFNSHYAVQWNNPVVKTSAWGPLISMRPFAGGKCSAWLVSKECPRLWGSKPSYTKICYSSDSHPGVRVPPWVRTMTFRGTRKKENNGT